MRSTTFLGIASALLLTTTLAFATDQVREDHERWEREQMLLRPRGELAAEQIARIQAEPKDVLETDRVILGPVEAELVRRLRDAKRSGDVASIMQVEHELADYRGKPLEFIGEMPPGAEWPMAEIASGSESEHDRWLPHEFLVAGEDYPELKPSLASDSAGNLYAAYQVEETPGIHKCRVSRSTNGGEHWSILFTYYGPDLLINPSIAIGEGTENWLFLTFHDASAERIYLARYNLDNPGQLELTVIMSNSPGVSSPRLVSDSSEYTGWYMHLVFNAMAEDNWELFYARTLDFGVTWTDPEVLAEYCGGDYPIEFYDGANGHPDIEYGSDNLYIAFDNFPSPCLAPDRCIHLLISRDYGATWDPRIPLTAAYGDEHDPAVAAVKDYFDNPTAVVAFTLVSQMWDEDIWYRYTQDDGSTWSSNQCLACTGREERNVNLATSNIPGAIHAAFWDEMNIYYAAADYTTPDSWVRADSLSTLATASDIGVRPGMLIDPTKPVAEEAGIAWTDERLVATDGLNIYYDAAVLPDPDDDFYVYSSLDPGVGIVCAIDGFIDVNGLVEGLPGAEYLFFTGGPLYVGDITAYVYRVETAGDPQTHPDNPLNTGPIATRTFTFVNSHYLGYFASAHDNAFYIDESGIYYGPSDNAYGGAPGWATFMSCAIYHWDFDWNPIGCVVPDAAPSGNQTLARNPANGDWWAGRVNREMYKWAGASWDYQFRAPHLGGGHHDGLEIIGGSLYVSDMTSDAIIQYRLDDAGNPIDPPGSPCKTFFYTHGPSVEGMGYGPNDHIWISSGGLTLYEIGGGVLQLAFEGIPDQCILPEEAFETFDLDDYVAGVPPYVWSWEGNIIISVSVDQDNVVTLTYPPGWQGQETITFTVVDGLGRVASDQAIFTVCAIPVVGDIPDQTAPFVPFDLDDYLLAGLPELITWTASGMICLEVTIDPVTHVATVTNPGGCSTPEDITFTAFVVPCEELMSDSDVANFDPGISSVTEEQSVGFALQYPVPSPMTTTTSIMYSIPPGALSSEVTLAVYDVTGHLVRTLVNESGAANTASLTWNGTNDKGLPVTSGTYFFQLHWNGKHVNRRVVLLR